MTRKEKILEARRMKAEGLSSTDIGRALSVSPSTIRNWCLGGTCGDCGTPITYKSLTYQVERCPECAKDEKYWTRERVIEAIQRWAKQHDRPPCANEWINARQGYPSRNSVYRSTSISTAPFATWNDAITVAGFVATPSGHYPRGGMAGLGTTQRELLDILTRAGHPMRWASIALLASCSPSHLSLSLGRMCRRGLVTKLGKGQYVIANHERRAA